MNRNPYPSLAPHGAIGAPEYVDWATAGEILGARFSFLQDRVDDGTLCVKWFRGTDAHAVSMFRRADLLEYRDRENAACDRRRAILGEVGVLGEEIKRLASLLPG